MDEIIALLELTPDQRVIDIGCGKGELLIRIIERYGVWAEGVDHSPWFLAEARERARARCSADRLLLTESAAADVEREPGRYDVAICVGATGALGGYGAALDALSELIRAGGLLLVGEPYWRRPPDAEYLSTLGASRDDHLDHAGNALAGISRGLVLHYSTCSTKTEWDHYESLYCRGIERHAVAHPEDPEVPEMLERVRRMRHQFLRAGRDTLGFGFYLFFKK